MFFPGFFCCCCCFWPQRKWRQSGGTAVSGKQITQGRGCSASYSGPRSDQCSWCGFWISSIAHGFVSAVLDWKYEWSLSQGRGAQGKRENRGALAESCRQTRGKRKKKRKKKQAVKSLSLNDAARIGRRRKMFSKSWNLMGKSHHHYFYSLSTNCVIWKRSCKKFKGVFQRVVQHHFDWVYIILWIIRRRSAQQESFLQNYFFGGSSSK